MTEFRYIIQRNFVKGGGWQGLRHGAYLYSTAPDGKGALRSTPKRRKAQLFTKDAIDYWLKRWRRSWPETENAFNIMKVIL